MAAIVPLGVGGGSKAAAPAPKPTKAAAPPPSKIFPGGIRATVATGGSAKTPKNYQLPKKSTGPAPKPSPTKQLLADFNHGSYSEGGVGPDRLASAVMHIPVVGKALTEGVNLPIHVADGALALGQAAVNDAIHGRLGSGIGGGIRGQSQSGQDLATMVHSDPVYQAVTGHPKALIEHPVSAGLDLAGGLGAVDRVAGGLARAGVLGPKAADLADMTPLRRVVTPSINTPDGAAVINSPEDAVSSEIYHISPGLAKGAAQKYMLNNAPGAYNALATAGGVVRHPIQTIGEAIRTGRKDGLEGIRIPTARQRAQDTAVDTMLAATRGAAQAERGSLLHTLHQAEPKNEAAANIAPQMMHGLPEENAAAHESLQRSIAEMQRYRANHTLAGEAHQSLREGDLLGVARARDILSPAAQRELDKAQAGEAFDSGKISSSLKSHFIDDKAMANSAQTEANNRAVLNGDEDVLGQARHAGRALNEAQRGLNADFAQHKILPPEQMENRSLSAAALNNHLIEEIPEKALPGKGQLQFRAARDYWKQATSDLKDARNQASAATQRYLPEHTELKNAVADLGNKQAAFAKRQGVIIGRHGTVTRLDGTAVSRADYERLMRKDTKLAAAEDRVTNAQAQLKLRKYQIRHNAANTIAAKKDTLDDARSTLKAAAANKGDRVGGFVVRDPNHVSKVNPLGYRNVQPEEIAKLLSDAGVVDRSYMSGLHESPMRANLTDRGVTRGGYLGTKFKGMSVKAGTYETGYSGAVRSILRNQRILHNTKLTDTMINNFGHRPGGLSDGVYTDPWERQRDAAALKAKTGDEYIPVRVRQQSLSPDDAKAIDEIRDPAMAQHVIDEHAISSLKNPAGDEPSVLMPKRVMDRLDDHVRLSKPTALGTSQNLARRAYLTFSPKYQASVFGEGVGRGLSRGWGPHDLAAFHQVMPLVREANPEVGKMIDALTGAGTNYGMHDRDIHNDLTRSQIGAKPTNKLVGGLQKIGRAYNKVTDVPLSVPHKVEQLQTQTDVGHYFRGMLREMSGSMLKANTEMHKYAQDIANGVAHDPARVVDISKHINRTLGKYNAFSPYERHVISNYMPFMPWFRNAAEFMYATLPHDHPLLTSALNSFGEANQSKWNAQHAGTNFPTDMLDDLPTGGGGYRDIGRFFPIGIAPFVRDPASLIPQLTVPGLSGAYDASHGVDSFGHQLKDSNGKPLTSGEKTMLVLSNLLGGAVAGPAQAERALEAGYGLKPSGDSTLWSIHAKHNTAPSGHFNVLAALDKGLNPATTIPYGNKSGGWVIPKTKPLSPAALRRALEAAGSAKAPKLNIAQPKTKVSSGLLSALQKADRG